MKKTIIVKEEDGSILIFESKELAQRYIEPIDVKSSNDTYYDSEGKILQAKVVESSTGIEHTVIFDNGKGIYKSVELQELLIDFLEYFEYSRKELKDLNLSELIFESLKYKTE